MLLVFVVIVIVVSVLVLSRGSLELGIQTSAVPNFAKHVAGS